MARTKLGLRDNLAGLFGRPPGNARGPLSAAVPRRATDLYMRYFHAGVPFSLLRLSNLWERCQSSKSDSGECERARTEVEERLGLKFLAARRANP